MKKIKSFMSILLVLILMLCMTVIAANADSEPLNTATKVSFTVNCNKPHYEFTVYKVANLKRYNPASDKKYQVVYESLISSISASVANGNSADLLAALDQIEAPTGSVGTYKVDTDGQTKTFSNLDQGIYYVRATNFPSGVKSVTNSVFALPYYSGTDGWVYTIDPIQLATKVDEDEAGIVKTITNSTKQNPNYTDVSLGDTVNFEIKTDTVGSGGNFTLGSYIITDKMSKGLTLNGNSFVVKLLDASGAATKTLTANTDYKVSVTATDGADTDFTVSMTATELAKDEFYAAKKVSVTYSAVLNKHAIVGKVGNPNEAVSLDYSNKNGVTTKINGNKVYVYTYALRVNKFNESGSALEGAEFALFKKKSDTTDNSKAIATGTSGSDGIVKFLNSNNNEMKLASGTYFIKETKAPNGYNRYTDTITAKIDVTYGDTLVNNTYVTSEPSNGIASIDVKNTKTVLPQTGGTGVATLYFLGFVFAGFAAGAFLLSKKKKHTAK